MGSFVSGTSSCSTILLEGEERFPEHTGPFLVPCRLPSKGLAASKHGGQSALRRCHCNPPPHSFRLLEVLFFQRAIHPFIHSFVRSSHFAIVPFFIPHVISRSPQLDRMASVADVVLNSKHKIDYKFHFDDFLRSEYRFGLDPSRPICRFYVQGHCPLGKACPDKHSVNSTSRIVCKHWLRGLCKKGEACEFLHEYNLRKMPECYFYSKHGYCSNGDECLYLHIDPESRIPPCPWFERGFCALGPDCSKKHIRRTPCKLFITGFCPKGPECPDGHPKFEKPSTLPTRKNVS